MEFKLTQAQKAIVKNMPVYIVGGAVRDLLLNKEPKDIDFAIPWLPGKVKDKLRMLGFHIIPDENAFKHGIVRFPDPETGELIDIATFRNDISCDGRHAEVEFTEDIIEDLSRRDLTINAMAARVNHDTGFVFEIIDPHGGRADISDKTIRFVGNADDRIKEDYLRSIRACRFTALGESWCMAPDTETFIHANRQGIKQISKERIRDEILKGLSYSKPSNFFRTLHATGLLTIIFPDLAKGDGVEQNEFHSETVILHLFRCLDCSVDLTGNVLLRLATLTHDIAKPHTKSTDEEGRVHFYKHEVVGENIMRRWMREYKFSNDDIAYVTMLVRNHQWRFEDDTKDKTIRRWLNEVGKETWRDLITLRCADRKGNLKKADRPMITNEMKKLISRVEGILAAKDPVFKEDLAINGHDLVALGVPPGKVYKEIFSNLLGIVLNEPEKNTKEWCTSWVQLNYASKQSET